MVDELNRSVPRTLAANAEWRTRVYSEAYRSKAFRQDVWRACSRDFLFWVTGFCWTYDPRKEPAEIPFVPYPFQDEGLRQINDSMGREDLFIEKSRDMGVSWMTIYAICWRLLFKKRQSFLLLSRKEDLVDSPGDLDSLFAKIDFVLEHLPGWMVPKVTRTNMHIWNSETKSVVDGESTNGDAGRGGRRTAIVIDEMAAITNGHEILSATRDNTKSRIFVSTPKGQSNSFYQLRQTPVRKLSFHWTLHPEKALGLYERDGKKRSPWYDLQCQRAAHQQEIASELDIDYLGSDFSFFSTPELDRIKAECCREPISVGDLTYDSETVEPLSFEATSGGCLKLWCNLDVYGKPPRDRDYVMGIDVAQGTGASNSAIVVADCRTMEKVAEFVSSRLQPYRLAKMAVSMARWFRGPEHGARMRWEANGPGREFGQTVIESGYRRIYYRTDEKRLAPKPSDFPGWFSTVEAKVALFGDYRRALTERLYLNRSRDAVEECRSIVYTTTGTIAHSAALATFDPSGARESHGDLPTADALCWAELKTWSMRRHDDSVPEGKPLAGSLWERHEEWRKEKAESELW